jgi:hypothetical protein
LIAAMWRVIGALLVGAALGSASGAAQPGALSAEPLGNGESALESERRKREELFFLVQIAERASDRVLNDIRAFNAVAYALLGPVLAIVTFLDYKDVWNFGVLPFALAAVTFSFLTVLSGDGYPSPRLSERFFRSFKKNPERARRIILRDLRTLAPANERQSRQKRRDLWRAAWATLAAVLAAVGVKSVESTGANSHVKDQTLAPTVCTKECDGQNASWLLWDVEPRAGTGRRDVIRLRPCNWTRFHGAGLDRSPAPVPQEIFVQTPLIVATSGRAPQAFPHSNAAASKLPLCSKPTS